MGAAGRGRDVTDRADTFPVRPGGSAQPGHGQAAGRTRVPGADPEHPRRVRLRWDLRPDAAGTRGRPRDAGVGGQAAVVRRLDRAGRPELPGLRPVGGGRSPAAGGQGDDPAYDRVGADTGVPAQERHVAGDAVRMGCADRHHGTPLGDFRQTDPGRENTPRSADASAGPGRCRRRRPPHGLHSGHPRARHGRPALGRNRPPAPGGRRDRAGQLDRRLVRHLPARPAPRLPDPAGGGAPGPAHDRAVDAHVVQQHGDERGHRVRARPHTRRAAAPAPTGATIRDG